MSLIPQPLAIGNVNLNCNCAIGIYQIVPEAYIEIMLIVGIDTNSNISDIHDETWRFLLRGSFINLSNHLVLCSSRIEYPSAIWQGDIYYSVPPRSAYERFSQKIGFCQMFVLFYDHNEYSASHISIYI